MIRHLLTALLLAHLAALHCDQSTHTATLEVHQTQYLKGLIPLQKKLADTITDLLPQVLEAVQRVREEKSTIRVEMDGLWKGLEAQRERLLELRAYVSGALDAVPCNLIEEVVLNRDRLSKVTKTMGELAREWKEALFGIDGMGGEVERWVSKQQWLVKAIAESLLAECTYVPKVWEQHTASGLVDVSQSKFKNNLNANGWTFGNMTEQQYKFQVFSESIKYNLVDCPLETPFVNVTSQTCFSCPQGTIFNLGLKSCQCPEGQVLNQTVKACQLTCTTGQAYNFTTKKCEVPTSPAPVACPYSSPIYNTTSNQCEKCPLTAPVYNLTTRQCMACPTGTAFDEKYQQCVVTCAQDSYLDPATQKCVLRTQCPAGYQWNASSQKCELQCPAGSSVDPRTGTCQAFLPTVCNQMKPVWNPVTYSCEICPQTAPVWNKDLKNCEACPPVTPVYDYATFKCVEKICEKGLKWNRDLLKCSPETMLCPKGTAYVFPREMCVQKCESNHSYIAANDSCECFPDKPVFNMSTRLCEEPVCASGLKWNVNLLKCVEIEKMCSGWQTYNFTAGACVDRCPINVAYVKANDSCVCPPAQPTFDAKTRQCLVPTCDPGFKWNVILLKCSPVDKKCQVWQNYNFETELCVDKCQVNATYVPSDDTCLCPADFPLFDARTRKCVQPVCSQGLLWNKFLLKCSLVKKVCEPWQIYNFQNEGCTAKCEVNQTYTEKTDSCTCPPQRPTWDAVGKKCGEPVCQLGLKWNPNLLLCIAAEKKCQAWQMYNFTAGQCVNRCEVGQTWISTNDSCNCTADHPFFNLTLRKCTEPTCPSGSQWNKLLKTCTLVDKKCEIWQTYSFQQGKCLDKCEVNHTYDRVADSCSCFAELPVFDNQTRKCKSPDCSVGSLWNKQLLKCSLLKKNCSVNEGYNFSTENCDTKCQVNVTYVHDNETCLCPADRPLFEAAIKKCLEPQCPSGSKWNANLIKCSPLDKKCESWSVYNFTAEECIAKCEVNQVYYKENSTCSCTPEVPLYDKASGKCVEPKCPEGQLWNRALRKCSVVLKVCEKWQAYNFAAEKCEDRCEANHIYYPSNNTCQCFPSAPFFDKNSSKCVIPPCGTGFLWNKIYNKCSPLTGKCEAWELYNFTAQKCDKKCDLNRTYYVETDTCQCPSEFPVFDKATRNCVVPQCPANSRWNKFILKCSPVTKFCEKWEFYDFSMEKCVQRCELNHTYYQSNDSCECFGQKPSFNATTRICEETRCQAGFKWNPTLKKCASLTGFCPRWSVYNFTDGTCTEKCQHNQTYFFDNDTCSCTPADPIFDRTSRKCVQPICLRTQIWSRELFRCSCVPGYFYSEELKACAPTCSAGYQLNKTTMTCDLIKPICAVNMVLDASNRCQCLFGYVPDQRGVGCRLQCPAGYVYNALTGLCDQIGCQKGYSYNSVSRKCEEIVVVCPAGSYYNKATQQCMACLSGFTYNPSTNQCEAQVSMQCPQGYKYNPTTKLCYSSYPTCGNGMYYSKATGSCLEMRITNPKAGNLITRNITAYTQTYNQQKSVNSGLVDCVAPTSFYDKVEKVCVQCPSSHPYFNLDENKCQDCGGGSYNANALSCESSVKKDFNFDPTIGRFVMNVF